MDLLYTIDGVIDWRINWLAGVVSAGRHDGSGLRTDRWNLSFLVRFLWRQSSREEDCHDVQTFVRAALISGRTSSPCFRRQLFLHRTSLRNRNRIGFISMHHMHQIWFWLLPEELTLLFRCRSCFWGGLLLSGGRRKEGKGEKSEAEWSKGENN